MCPLIYPYHLFPQVQQARKHFVIFFGVSINPSSKMLSSRT